jgi:hypothetical protein
MEKNILKQIFFDGNHNWDKFVEKNNKRIRSVVLKEVEKFRQCGDPQNGFKLFVKVAMQFVESLIDARVGFALRVHAVRQRNGAV